jgi:phospho-2-dehydro-3-deoxyheptonate aldolase
LKPLVQQYAKELVIIMRVYFEKVRGRDNTTEMDRGSAELVAL